jgi:hypothetical protein
LIDKVLFAVGLFTCNVDTAVFTTWMKHFLLPNLNLNPRPYLSYAKYINE